MEKHGKVRPGDSGGMRGGSEIFTIRARKCLRCGRLLTSAEAVELGYGCRCAELAEAERREKEPLEGQIDIYEVLGIRKGG